MKTFTALLTLALLSGNALATPAADPEGVRSLPPMRGPRPAVGDWVAEERLQTQELLERARGFRDPMGVPIVIPWTPKEREAALKDFSKSQGLERIQTRDLSRWPPMFQYDPKDNKFMEGRRMPVRVGEYDGRRALFTGYGMPTEIPDGRRESWEGKLDKRVIIENNLSPEEDALLRRLWNDAAKGTVMQPFKA